MENFGRILNESRNKALGEYPLTPPQMGIYLACVNNPKGTMYNIPLACRFKKGSVDIDKLSAAVKKAVANHPALTVRFDASSGSPVMKPSSGDIAACVPVLEADDLSRAEREFVRPFDILSGEPLFRFAVLENAESGDCSFVMDFHHIICDGTSVAVICGDIARAYDGDRPQNEELSIFNLSVFEQLAEDSEEYAASKKYYDKIFGGVEASCAFAEDFKDDPTLENKPSREFTLMLGDKLSRENVKAFTEKSGITAYTLFLGAFEYAAAKFTGQSENVLCSVTHGRFDSRLKNTVGMLVKTLPFYSNINENDKISDYLLNVRRSIKQTVKNDAYPFIKLAADYDLSADFMLAYQSDIFTYFTLNSQKLRLKLLPTGSALSKLCVMVFKTDEGFELRLEYRSDLFCEETVRSFAQTYVKILQELLTKQTLSEVELLSDEQARLIDGFTRTEVPFDSTKTVVDLFCEQAEKYPQSTAVAFKEKKFTYAEANALTDRIAAYIRRESLGKGDVVSVLIPRCEYMPLAALGVLKSGAAYQPLDPSYPPERLDFMTKDADAQLLIADEGLLEILPEYKGRVLLTRDIPSLPTADREALKAAAPDPDDLFTLIYTSGSTGVPKGCMVEHKNVAAFCDYFRRSYELTSSGVFAAYASFGFDACLMEMYSALTAGAQLHIIEEDIRLDLVRLNKYFESNGVSHVFMTTQVARRFALEIENHSLKYLLTGGERLVPLAPPKGYTLINGYGPSETVVYITTQPVDKLYDRIPVGKALDNIKLYVIDRLGRRLPVGALGELCISGLQVTRGYLNRPEKTAEVYAKNPYTGRKGYERLYHTGDVVRFLPDGRVDFIGRNDGQVKIRGFRIELSEVEEVIRRFPGIKDATVAAFDGAGGGKYVAAYVVSDTAVDIDALNAFIAAEKPPYMVPEVTMQIDKIPLNQNQKVNRRALPKPERKPKKQTTREMTLLEKKISAVIEKIIGHSDFDVAENLINAGMTSLSVIGLAVELNKAFGLEANVKKMMKGCSVLSIENELQELMLARAMGLHTSEVKPAKPHKDKYPLSQTQLGVYVDSIKNPYSTLYNIPVIFTFPQSADPERLRSCAVKALKAHPYVSAHIVQDGSEPEQTYVDSFEPEVSLSELSQESFERFKKEFVKPHNLSKAPLFRMGVVKTEQNVYLLCDFHHIIFDGASLSLLCNQLKTLYEGGSVERESYTYYDYIENELAAHGSDEYKAAEGFFDGMFKDYEAPSEITPDLSGKLENGTLAEAAVPVDIRAVQSFCAENGVTPAHLFLAAVFYTVSRFTNSRSVYISTISNGRSDMRLTNCFGMFVKTLPLGVTVEDVTAIEFVRRSCETMTGAIENEIYPYSELCAKYRFSPEIMYEYQLGVVDDLIIDGKAVERDYLEMSLAKFKLAVRIEEHDGRPCVVAAYNSALYSADLMQTLAQSVACAAQSIIKNPGGRVREISLLSNDEEKRLESFRSTLIKDIDIKILHKMFEAQAAKTPDRAAISACDGKLTYRELDRLSNIAANSLIALGFKKGGRAVLLLERTSKFFVALLGVLKAGGAFVPTCPDYPKQRVADIINDSAAAAVICGEALLGEFDRTVSIDKLLAGTNDKSPNIEVSPEDLAYLIYTSGSTGKPKGVMLRHSGIASYLTYSSANIQVKEVVDNCSVYGSVTTISFDMSLKETLLSLCSGLTLAFASDEQTKNPLLLAEFFKENRIDAFNSTPSRLLQYMELDEFAEVMAGCKVILSGGEKYPDKLLKVLREKTNATIINTYGPTEITVSSNAAKLTNADKISVGKPLMNYAEYIVDSDNNLLPVGVVGELLISGAGVALGYNNLPEQTAKAFISFKGERTYRSGDYAKWTPDGDVIILGRTDNQVKLRGLRIELGEIEKCLTNVDGIKSAVVLIKRVGKAEAICAYYTAEHELDPEYIKSGIKNSLTDYMLPSAYVYLEKMPLTPNGKINVRKLPEPELCDEKGSEAKTELERTFCDIFAEVLELDKVYADQGFFDIGGTSLTVSRVVIEAHKRKINLAYSDLFTYPTPRELAAFVGGTTAKNGELDESLGSYDYTAINNLLLKNNLESFKCGARGELGTVLVTGSTGFLGVHILYELLHRHSGKVYCMLRSKHGNSAEKRMNSIFYYYFEESLRERYPDRLTVLEGDVTDKLSFDKFTGLGIDTVINCAANVKHFSKGTDIEDVNLNGALNVLDFCKKSGARLVHISTMSVGGMFVGCPGKVDKLKETQLYFGQYHGSKYTLSKFLAERAILEAAANGFNAKIMRVGTLAARNSDGEYQINFTTNTFMGRVKSTLLIGKYPYEAMEQPFELSPIDFVAKAILLLAQAPKDCTVFHPFNNHTLIMGDLYTELNRMGLKCSGAEPEDYAAALEAAEGDPEKAEILSSMIAYQDMAHGQKTFPVGKSNAYTMQVLYRLGFVWPVTSLDYMKRFISSLRGFGFFG